MNMPEVYMRKTEVIGGLVDHKLLLRKYLISPVPEALWSKPSSSAPHMNKKTSAP
ncbi:hypothetical protein [Paenibacillus sp. FJAT-26967]|uniref:hypothetical protein n=1 Tax=Paenibacillus sp. FJAT-26967 TaxID=1729690 RepID=UPI000ADE9015|nr:hypothetical protein [Paenibacillus sp. FJAT-26967]